MKFLPFVLALASVQGVLSSGCLDDNCARAVTGTRNGKVPDVTSRRQDCSNFMKITITPATSTISATTTVTTTTTPGVPNKAKRHTTISMNRTPTYASACSGTVRYSSACSCWGITVRTITAATPLTTTTITATATVTAAAPGCPPGQKSCGGGKCIDVSTDPQNCGACGVTCPAGATCVNGACSNPSCDGKTCGHFANCNGVDTCFCFTTADTSGFCAQDAQCADLPGCVTNADCGQGSICAVNSCCVRNVCLTINCANPAKVLMRFAKKQVGCSAASC